MILLVITLVALVVYLVLNDSYVRVREVARLTYFAGALAIMLQYGTYFNALIKETLR